jgi:sulfide:quinone oxidoreductase
MSTPAGDYRVVVVGGGVAALEVALALSALAPGRTDVTVITSNGEFVYRPMTVGEPFSYGLARRYPLEPIVRAAGARLLCEELEWIERDEHLVHTKTGKAIAYDALVLALGARPVASYEHAVTVDDKQMDETLHGLVQDVEGGYIHSLAFLSAERMAWPLPLYELALMTAGRAYDSGLELAVTIVTPEDSPLQIFGDAASSAVAALLKRAHIEFVSAARIEMPKAGEVLLEPGKRHLRFDRAIALPELQGPTVRGIPLGDHGFIAVDPYGRVPGVEDIYAAGDATNFPVKHGGISAQQADAVAQSIAAAAGAPVTPERLHPVIRGMLLTDQDPLYLTARLTGGGSFDSETAETPLWSPASKISARYLAPYLDGLDQETTRTDPPFTSQGQTADQKQTDPGSAMSTSTTST